ncbi:MAG: branched-chain amino acid ABC transporter permease [Alphaproteobacteria bacterium]
MNIAQVIVNSIVSAAELGIVAVGLTLTFSILKFANFAHTETAVMGGYLAYVFNAALGLDFTLSLVLAALIMGFVGILFDRGLFRVMRDKGDVTPMIASLGLAIAIRHAIQAIWGPQNVRYDYEVEQGIEVAGAFITEPQIGIIVIVVVAMLAFQVMLKYTSIGKAMRATATNPTLAQASSIDTERVILLVWFIGTSFAAIGGVLVAWDTQLDPYLGFNITIPVFCVVLIGGVGSMYGAIIGALIVGFAQNLGVSLDFASLINSFGLIEAVDVFRLPAAYKPAIVYAAVILVLLLKPSGLAKRELL